jgi:hypothetical protein
MELKWILAVGAEATFWALLLAFLLLRYRYGRDGASVAVLVAILADHVVILGLGAWDFAQTGRVSAYTLAIVALLVYAVTFGKRDVVRVDAWAKRRFSPRVRRGRPGARCAPLPPR